MMRIAARNLRAPRALLMACALAASCHALQAQPDGPGGPPPDGPPPGEMQPQSRGPSVDRELKQLTQLLTLTTAQQTQVKAILTDEHQQVEALMSQSRQAAQGEKTSAEAGDDREAHWAAIKKTRAAVEAVREEAHAKIAAALSDDQKTKFTAWEKKREKAAAREESDDMPPPPPDGGDGPPPDGGGGAPGGGGPPGN